MRQLRRYLFITPLLASAALADVASGSETKAVIELFTSQGCSACPPADKLFETFARRKDMVALSFNVDYWDYLGWKDTLAKHAYSERQRAYAQKRGDGEVYTPQIVINGVAHAVGSRKHQIDATLATTLRTQPLHDIPIDITGSVTALEIRIGAGSPPPSRPATVWLATVDPSFSVKIRRGENHGRRITYFNAVRNLSAVGMWSGKPATITVGRRNFIPKKGMRCAVLVQAEGGAMIAARWIER